MKSIQRIVLHRLEIPLTRPYVLSIRTVKALDTVLVEMIDTDGVTGYGEATVLTGYTHETIDDVWRRIQQLAESMVGLDPQPALDRLAAQVGDAPFTVTALATAVEMLNGIDVDFATAQSVPLLAPIADHEPSAVKAEVEDLLSAGYRTLKIKVGFDVDDDLRRVAWIQRVNAGRARLRIDANQGYSRTEAIRFVTGLEPDSIELVEQTCAADDWDAAVATARVARVPMMLDESIYGVDDVERAAQLGAARFIKFKLMKAGGLARLRDAVTRIRTLGMVPILGNGVAADIGCWLETVACAAWLDNAGEMNGFLKTDATLVANPLRVCDGAVRLPAGYRPQLDRDRIARHRIAIAEFSHPARAPVLGVSRP